MVDVLKHSSVLVGSLYLSLSLILPFLLVFVMEKFGVPRRVGSFVIPIPTGYSFNLDGSMARRSTSCSRLAQAAGIKMSFTAQLMMVFTSC